MFVVMKNPRAMREDRNERASYAVGAPATASAIPGERPVEQKEITTIQNADGSTTTTTTTTVTNADGSSTVTTTTEVTPGATQFDVASAKVIP
jgi:predicted lipid-binding transport protein (Tim44 family)